MHPLPHLPRPSSPGPHEELAAVPARTPSLPPEYLADLSLAEIIYEERAAQWPHAARPRVLALLLAAQPEIERLATLAAIEASVANALASMGKQWQCPPKPRTLLRFFPSPTSKYILAASRLRRSPHETQTAKLLDQFSQVLDAASQATVTLAQNNFVSGAPSGFAQLAARWRATCRAAVDLLQATDADLAGFKLERTSAMASSLHRALVDAEAGGCPMIAADGTVGMPAWADSRRQRRVRVECGALLHHPGGYQDVALTDISTLGIGLRCPVRLAVGARVTLYVDPAIVMIGRVAWWNADNAGIEFDLPFYDQSPELRFLIERSEPFAAA